jgi:dTDP-4-dehydrorhamnose reductase
MLSVLVTGATGYTGQFIVDYLREANFEVVCTHSTRALEPGSWRVCFETGFGIEEMLDSIVEVGKELVAVVNLVAISKPAECEQDPERAAAINVPLFLIEALKNKFDTPPKFIHFSTDQVYSGKTAFSTEISEVMPVNEYGISKKRAEEVIASHLGNYAILRSSLIYGPAPFFPVARPLFVQFIAEQLSLDMPCSFFIDEWRSPICVTDICEIVKRVIEHKSLPLKLVLNVGGPQRLSRYDMALMVAQRLGVPTKVLPASSSSVSRGFVSPVDTSLCVTLCSELLDFTPSSFDNNLQFLKK